MKRRTLFLIVVLLLLAAASSTSAFKHYRTDYGRYEESESYTIEYDFRHLRKQFNAADEQGKVAIIKTVFRDSWVLANDRLDEEGRLCHLTDSRGAFDNRTLKAQDLLNLSPESRYELLLAAKEIIASDKRWKWQAPERMKVFALWVKNAKSIEKDQDLKSFVKEYLSQWTYGRDDVIACYLAYCSLSDDEFNQITASIVSDMRDLLKRIKPGRSYAFPLENYDVEHLPLVQKIAEQKLLPERNVSSLVETLGELFTKIPPYDMEEIVKPVHRDADGIGSEWKVLRYELEAVKANCEIAKTLKVIARRYRTLGTQIDEMLKKDATRRKGYSPASGGVMRDYFNE